MPNVSTRLAAQQLALFGHGKLPRAGTPAPDKPVESATHARRSPYRATQREAASA